MIHHTCDRQHCGVGNTAQQRRLGLFQDPDFAGDFEDSRSTSGGIPCIFGSRTFVPVSWMSKKQTSVFHSSTEAEVISLNAGLRMDGIPALDLRGSITFWHGETRREMRFEAGRPTPTPKRRDTVTVRMMSSLMRTTSSQAKNLLTAMLTFLRTMKQ